MPTVKILTKITSGFLAAYLFMLPVLFGFHSLEHQHDYFEEQSADVEFVQSVTDCTVCSLYFEYQNQSAINVDCNHSEFTVTNFSSFIFTNEEIITVFTDFKSLRGPPTA